MAGFLFGKSGAFSLSYRTERHFLRWRSVLNNEEASTAAKMTNAATPTT
jgi:hypothetical protein